MYFASDNAGKAHPDILQALMTANTGYVPSYGGDALTAAVTEQLREIFEAPEAAVYLVTNGTSANALALATLAQPWDTIYCSPLAHIHEDECNAPEFYTGGAKLTLVGDSEKMTPEALRAAIGPQGAPNVHGPQPGPLSITQVTERGTLYSLEELTALTAVAKEHNMPVHLDGARFANALVALGCTPAEMSWKAGVDAVSFGGSKNGCLGVEAVIFFDPAKAWEFELRRKRGGHLMSKHRYLAAQMQAYLTDGLWLSTARQANAKAARLAAGLRDLAGVGFAHDPQANMLFITLPRRAHQVLYEAGAQYYLIEGSLEGTDPDAPLLARLVCDWSIPETEIDRFLDILRSAL